MLNKKEVLEYSSKMINQYEDIYKIDIDLYDQYNVKRGLRDKNGNGVLAGISHSLLEFDTNGEIGGYQIYRGEKNYHTLLSWKFCGTSSLPIITLNYIDG